MVRGYKQPMRVRQWSYTAPNLRRAHFHDRAVHLLMLFGTALDRPHEERPLRAGHRTASILIAVHARPEADIDAVVAEVENAVRESLSDWYDHGGSKLVEAVPDVV